MSFPGLSFAKAISSWTLATPSVGLATNTDGAQAIKAIGANSLVTSVCGADLRAALMFNAEVVSINV